MNNLNGKTIVIDGVEYRLTALVDKRTMAVVSKRTPVGTFKFVVPRNTINEDVAKGLSDIQYCTEEEAEKIAKTIDNDKVVLDFLQSLL